MRPLVCGTRKPLHVTIWVLKSTKAYIPYPSGFKSKEFSSFDITNFHVLVFSFGFETSLCNAYRFSIQFITIPSINAEITCILSLLMEGNSSYNVSRTTTNGAYWERIELVGKIFLIITLIVYSSWRAVYNIEKTKLLCN